MVIFATPDFGAGAAIAGCVVVLYAAAFLLAAGGVLLGAGLYRKASPRARRYGVALMATGGLVPLFCCLAPPCAIRVVYGNFPTWGYVDGRVSEGMSRDEVAAILGTPHERHADDGGESWYYWGDSFGVTYSCIRFGPDGRVTGTHRD